MSAKGRFLWIERYKNKDTERLSKPNRMRFKNLPMYSFTEFADERHIADMFNYYCHLFFSVMRGDAFLNALEQVPRYFPTTGWLDQFALTIVCGVRGKSHTSSRLYCVRQRHLAQDSARSAKTEPYRSWPRLLASPDFSEHCQNFRQCLIDGFRGFVFVSLFLV